MYNIVIICSSINSMPTKHYLWMYLCAIRSWVFNPQQILDEKSISNANRRSIRANLKHAGGAHRLEGSKSMRGKLGPGVPAMTWILMGPTIVHGVTVGTNVLPVAKRRKVLARERPSGKRWWKG
ncbi:hypothetical protein CVT26_000417 [Gymnopilus dilepis]|uniref:Uncharacterized protein n=1 Tax=Gymnopilus dilepis TaxID=231916 RepID=A0A409Y2B6_9AGAR|nr:hypothetical protein CVT26_000417 [Gymnopilus dilepis]